MRYLVGIALIVATLAISATQHNAHVKAVCGGAANVALCDLSLQAGWSDSRALAAGNATDKGA